MIKHKIPKYSLIRDLFVLLTNGVYLSQDMKVKKDKREQEAIDWGSVIAHGVHKIH